VETYKVKSGLFMLSQKALEEFKILWSKEFGEEISDEFAMAEATQLLTIFDVIYHPIKKEWLEEYENGKNRQHSK